MSKTYTSGISTTTGYATTISQPGPYVGDIIPTAEDRDSQATEIRVLRQRVKYLRAHVEELKLILCVQELRAQIAHLGRTTHRRKRTSVSTEDAAA